MQGCRAVEGGGSSDVQFQPCWLCQGPFTGDHCASSVVSPESPISPVSRGNGQGALAGRSEPRERVEMQVSKMRVTQGWATRAAASETYRTCPFPGLQLLDVLMRLR